MDLSRMKKRNEVWKFRVDNMKKMGKYWRDKANQPDTNEEYNIMATHLEEKAKKIEKCCVINEKRIAKMQKEK